MKSIFILDPGLMEAGGHHAALLETLIANESENLQLTMFSHKSLDGGLVHKAKLHGINVVPHFESNFYQHYEDSIVLRAGIVQDFIRQLAAEYIEALSAVAQIEGDAESVCFYPSLNWEHASALSLAISYLGKSFQSIHKVCCMFKPLMDNSQARLQYKLAFKQLNHCTGVILYASDWETKDYYCKLGIPIEKFHPCYLMPWQKIKKSKERKSKKPHILLYMGDAKADKGFNLLPEKVASLLEYYGNEAVLTVQYTLAWESETLSQTINRLRELSANNSGFQLIDKFWTIQDIVEIFNEISMVLCTYDTKVYQFKSSGLAWVSAYFNVPVVLQDECWLSREFKRLGAVYSINESLMPEISEVSMKADHDYIMSLYGNLQSWLLE